MVQQLFVVQETFAAENAKLYQSQAPSLRVPLSHQGVARTDRIYLSDEMFQDYSTSTSYIGDVSIFNPQPSAMISLSISELESSKVQMLNQLY